MRCFLLRVVSYVVIMAVLCGVVGLLLKTAENKAGGMTGRTRYLNDSLTAEVLIFGSSRALHHYNPIIIQSELHNTVYNCGEDKMGIIYNYGRYCIISRHHVPKVIVYDVEPDYDLLFNDNTSYLSGLRRYQNDHAIRQLFIDVDSWERFKTLLFPYMLNNRLIQTLKDCVSPSDSYTLGYSPYIGSMDVFLPEQLPQNHYDPLKKKYLQRLVDDCNGRTRIVFTASPQLSYGSDSVFVPLMKYCEEHRIPFLNHFCDTTFTNYPRLFYNANHLEKTGAERFSKIIAKEIKEVIKDF